jgi:hypothetical protein
MQIVAPRPAQTALMNPLELPNLAAWFDALDTSSMLDSTGAAITDGGAVALWADKSGNSGVNCLVLDGAVGNYASVPDAAALDILGDIDLRIDCAANNWTAGAFQMLVYKNVSPYTTGYGLRIKNSGGIIQLVWGNGSAEVVKESTAAPTVSNYGRLQLRATLDVDDGAGNNVVTFYTRASGTSLSVDTGWTQLGNAVTTAGTTSIGNSSAVLRVGDREGGLLFAGRVYQTVIKDGIAGTTALNIDFSQSAKKLANGDTFVCATGQTVTLNSSGATGARIAGERDLFQGTAANRPVYLAYSGTKYGYTTGWGNHFSAGDSVPLSITGDLDVHVCASLTSWTTGGQCLAGKFHGTTQRSWVFIANANKTLSVAVSQDGAVVSSVNSSAAATLTDGSPAWLRFTYEAATATVRFWESSDGVTWTELGTGQNVIRTAIFDSTADLTIGAYSGTGSAIGRFYRVRVYSGIAGTLAFDFNPATYTSGTTFTDSSSNAAAITLNGGATIVTRSGLYFDGSNDYLKTAAFSYAQPESVYLVGQQVQWVPSGSHANLFDGNALDGGVCLQRVASPQIGIYAGTNLGTISPPVKTAVVLAARFNGATSSLSYNRNTAVTGAVGSNNMNGFTLGNRGDNDMNYTSNITVSELILRSAADATATQDRIALYAGRKWGIAV